MTIVLDGTANTISGLAVGGLPAGTTTPTTLSQPLTLGTAQATTSGTSIDFTSIPSWVKRITISFNSISITSSSNTLLIQIGSGSITSTGYSSQSWAASVNSGIFTSGFVFVTNTFAAVNTFSGTVVLTLIGSNTWVSSGNVNYMNTASVGYISSGNSPSLSGTLDRIRLTTQSDTDTFDAGSVNIMYE
jgi:hypothetical protein